MQKPISMLITEFKTALHNAIKNAGLPPVLMEPVLTAFSLSVANMAEREAEREEAAYRKEEEHDTERDNRTAEIESIEN